MNLPYGRHRVLGWLQAKGVLDRTASLPFHGRRVVLRLNEATYQEHRDIGNYQIRRVLRFAAMCDGAMGNFDFIDCGAHLGLFAAQFAVQSYGVQQLTSIEPNRRLFPLMEANLRGARATNVRCINAALADFEGRGRLVAPEYDTATSALFLVADPTGDVDVITLSSVLRSRTGPNVAIKMDVEGQEGPVLCAAREEIRSLEKIALFVEVHQKVLDRIGISDVEMMEEIDGIRPFRWVNAQDGARVSPHRSIFDQVEAEQCDLVGISE